MSSALPPAFTEYLHLSYRPDLETLVVRWLRAVTLAELQTGFKAARTQAKDQQVARWLVDVRRRTELDAISSNWVANVLLPAVAVEAAPATLYVAYLLSPARAEVLNFDEDMRTTTAAAQASNQPYRLQIFLDEGEAVEWLLTR